MESGEDSKKRQREPLSDTEDNVLLPSEMKDGQKRRRLEGSGQENRSPKASSSRRLAELEVKPDTPALPSVRSRVQQLTQRREGGPLLTQRCLSDPGSNSPSVLIQDRAFRQNLLGEGEFSQRAERFKAPLFQPSPGPGPANPCPRTLSNFVSDIQQKLQGNVTPSSKQASRVRQEREQELRLLCSQPINDNAWLKRSISDPSLAEQAEDSADVVASEAESSPEMKDGSFTEASTSRAKLLVKPSGEKAACDSPGPALPIELKDSSSNEGEEREVEEEREEADRTMERRQGNAQSHNQHVTHSIVMEETEREGCTSSGYPQRQLVSFEEGGEEDSVPVVEECQAQMECLERREPGEASEGAGEREKEERAASMKEEELGSCHIEEQSMAESPIGVEQKIPEDSELVANMGSESFPEEESEESDDEEAMEPSTDEELRRWRYPGHGEHREEESSITQEEEEEKDTERTEGGQGERGSCAIKNEEKRDVADHIEPSEVQGRECHRGVVHSGVSRSAKVQEHREDVESGSEHGQTRSEIGSSAPSVKDQRAVDRGQGDMENHEADTAQTGDVDPQMAKRDPKLQELEGTIRSSSRREQIESDQSLIDPHTIKQDQNAEEPRTIDQHPLSQTGYIKQENMVEGYELGEDQTGQPRIADVVEVVMETQREDDPRHIELYISEIDTAQTMINTQISKGDDQKDIKLNREDVVQSGMEVQASTEDNPRHIELHIYEEDTAQTMIDTQISEEDYQKDIVPNREDVVQAVMEIQVSTEDNPADTEHNSNNIPDTLTEARTTEDHQEAGGETEPHAAGKEQGDAEVRTGEIQTGQAYPSEGRGVLKKVTFILEPELINDSAMSEMDTSSESRGETSVSEAELSSHDETNTAEMIDQMFGEVLEYAETMEDEGEAKSGNGDDAEDRDSGIGTCSVDKERMDVESEKEKREGEEEFRGEGGSEESKKLDTSAEELLTFPPSGILSPLSKSMEAVVTPLRLAANQLSNYPSLLLTPEEELTTPPPDSNDSAPLYSIDAYRTQRQTKLPAIQSVTPRVQRRAQEKSRPQSSINTKEKIAALNEEAGKLQTVINQTLQALSCCTDEEHGRGSLEEAEAEKLLLVSCEKRSALLAEVVRLREERGSESEEAGAGDGDFISLQPCRGTVNISNVQLPLKVEFVCSSRNRTGRPSHYFFVLIRYGPCNIVATPLATAADAQNGDTISFPTSVTLKDIRSNFEIDVEVYSLSHTSGNTSNVDRSSTKSRVTPRKLLSTITHRSNNSLTSALPAMSTRRSSNFSLVGSHKITLASLGQSKFPLDKMKFEGKIRKLLGDEFQEKVPFLSPLEGNIYLHLDSKSHSRVQHQGFLTMFEMVKGFGVWHRRYFVLDGYHMSYWNHPNDRESKAAEGGISLSSSSSQSVKPVKRDSCARPFTFELVSNIQTLQQDDSQNAFAKCWFSADTKQERSDWMDKLNQALLDLHTWSQPPLSHTDAQQAKTSSSGNLRESIL